MGVVLGVKLLDGRLVVAVALVRQQPNNKLGADQAARPEVCVLGIPQLSEQRAAVAVAVVNADRKADDGKMRLRAARPRGRR